MKYDDRTRIVGSWLQKLLRRYTPPTGMDNETLKEEMVLIVEDVNKNIPSQYEDKDIVIVLGKIDGHVRALHGARTWPTIKTFITSTKDAVKDYNSSIHVPQVTVSKDGMHDDYRIMIKRIKKGEPIPDHILKPESITRQKLIDQGHITEEDLDKYVAPTARMQ